MEACSNFLMVYVSFSLAIQVRHCPCAKTVLQKATGTWEPSSRTSSRTCQDCFHGIMGCIGAKQKSFVRIHEE